MQDTLLSIGKAAVSLGISIDTLRRWEKAGRLVSVRSGKRGHRYFRQSDISQFMKDEQALCLEWVGAFSSHEAEPDTYCSTRDVFQARLEVFQVTLRRIIQLPLASLITAVTGEIGNNSFDHNLGNWPDVPGIFFSYSFRKRMVVLGDRGLGVLSTLRRVRPSLKNDEEALRVAFTETISGRFPEARGNGLKFVRSIIVENPLILHFQSGDSYIDVKQYDKDIVTQKAKQSIRGCFVTIGFEEVT